MKKLAGVIALLIILTLLVACGDEPTATVVTPAKTSALNPTQRPQVSPASNGSGVPTPRIGPDGQITVVAPRAEIGNFKGTFYYTKKFNIWQGGTTPSSGTPLSTTALGGVQLTNIPQLATASNPSLSPSGEILAYSYSPAPDTSVPGKVTVGQDIMGYDFKTKTSRMLMQREEPNMFMDEAAWSADGKYIYAALRAPLRDKSGAVVGQRYGIQRVELATSKRETLAEDARSPAPSPDGKFLIFIGVAASSQTFEYSLNVMNLASKVVKTITTPDQNFFSYYFPRVSPDSQLIVFSAPGGPDESVTTAPNPTATPSSGFREDGSVHALSVAAHGLPYDLWVIKPDGTGLRRLTTLFEDQPMGNWSKDGQRIIFLAGFGLYNIDVATGTLSKKSDEGSHEGFDFRE